MIQNSALLHIFYLKYFSRPVGIVWKKVWDQELSDFLLMVWPRPSDLIPNRTTTNLTFKKEKKQSQPQSLRYHEKSQFSTLCHPCIILSSQTFDINTWLYSYHPITTPIALCIRFPPGQFLSPTHQRNKQQSTGIYRLESTTKSLTRATPAIYNRGSCKLIPWYLARYLVPQSFVLSWLRHTSSNSEIY